MSEMEHYPGPWELEPMKEGTAGPVWVHASRCHVAENVGLGNARLIAAAPELLAALHTLLEELDEFMGSVAAPTVPDPVSNPTYAKARQAIAKATGTEHV
jgi:hypothetical protein